ncbi:MAG: penicillin-binding protein activator [Alphaproteobacteria bacterium]
MQTAQRDPNAEGYGPFQFDPFGRSGARVKVALLLPLTGRGSELGPAMFNAAQMALFDTAPEDFELLPRDTNGTPEGAQAAAQAAIADGAQLILGPLFSASVPPVKSVAETAGVNVIAFTNDRTVAGGNALVLGFVPSGQVARVVRHSMEQGLLRYAILAPDTPYGQAIVAALQEFTAANGAVLERVQYYDPATPDLSPSVERIAEPGLFGTVPYDAIMLPDTGLRLRAVAAMLPYFDVRQVQLLGTGIWDEPDLGLEPSLVGGWFAAPQPDLRYDFEQRYDALFGQRPPRLATLAYDSVALAAALASLPGEPGFDMATLTDPSGFAGVDGVFRFHETGLVERGLAILQVTSEGSDVVSTAPVSFALAGS